MKKLTDADIALLKSRGKIVNGFTTIRSNDPIKFDTPKKVKKSKAKKTVEKNPLVGRKLHTSFGYDMTINDFAQIIEVSPTGKTVVCQMVNKDTNGMEYGPDGSGRATAGNNLHGPKFRLKVSGETSFHGSYPFCGNSKRFGYFSLCNDTDSFYENHWD